MTSVITGDIVNSQKVNPEIWLPRLKAELSNLGKSPQAWEIYRGDSFQLEIQAPSQSLVIALKIKSALKSIKQMDVRIAIGIGEKSYDAGKITESNGSAFINSGNIFEHVVKDKQKLAVASPSEEFNTEINLLLLFALNIMDNWTINSAEIVNLALKYPEASQTKLGEMLGIKQNAVSNRLKRAYYDDILELLKRYQLLTQRLYADN